MNTRYLTEAQATAFLGFIFMALAPYITAIFTQRRFSDQTKLMIALAICGVMGFFFLLITGQWSWANMGLSALSLFSLSQALFKPVFLKLGVRQVENWTTPMHLRIKDEPLPTSSTVEAAQAIEEVKEQIHE